MKSYEENQDELPAGIGQFFSSVSSQKKMDSPFSGSNKYWAFLSKVDQSSDDPLDGFDVLFEVIPQEYGDARLPKSDLQIKITPPSDPSSLFFLHNANEASLKFTLNMKPEDPLIEGNWFLVMLFPGEQSGKLTGDFFDPNIDMTLQELPPTKPIEPTLSPSGILSNYYLRYYIDRCTLTREKNYRYKREKLRERIQPYSKHRRQGKQKRLLSPPELIASLKLPILPPNPVASIGIMDVGQGNCNLLIDNTGNPIAYYDVGLPLPFFMQSAPDELKPGRAVYQGPILNNTTGNLIVILSHWDWDHWRMGRTAGLNFLDWLYPVQPMGPATAAFFATIPPIRRTAWPAFLPSMPVGSFIVRMCTGATINDSGLALEVPMNLPSGPPTPSYAALTGDASFGNVPLSPAALNDLAGITAVHHGSAAAGVLVGIPPSKGQQNGTPLICNNIAYSYGFYHNAAGLPRHPYGFPRPAAIAAYLAAGWHMNNTQNTAETALNSNAFLYGNFKIGANIPYPAVAPYMGTYFSTFTKAGLDS